MRQPMQGPVWRTLGRVLVPLYYPEYRRLLIRSYVLLARLELLSTFCAVVSPFATPALLRIVHRWLDQLRDDVAEFGHMVRTPVTLSRVQRAPSVGNDSGFQNPWI